jgi:dTDP-glucose 4,6-dehydratase
VSKRILVTGAAGFIASHLCRHILRSTDWQIVALDRIDPAGSFARLADVFHDYWPRIAMVHVDLRSEVSDGVALDLLTGGGKFHLDAFDYVAHLAASSHVDRAMIRPLVALADNVMGTANLLEFVRQHSGLKSDGKFWHMSTDEVMGPAPAGKAFGVTDRQFPRNTYAASKMGAEALCMAYAETFAMPIVMTRCTNVVAPRACATDPGQDKEKFIPTLVAKLLARETVQIHTVDGVPCSRYYVHVQNVCEAGMCVMEHGGCIDGTEGHGIYHISGDQEIDNVSVARLASDVLGAPLDYALIERPPGRLKPDLRYCLDDSSLRQLGWEPRIGCADGLRLVFESYRPEAKKAAE